MAGASLPGMLRKWPNVKDGSSKDALLPKPLRMI